MPNYQNSVIYTIVNSINGSIYVGSSSQRLSRRMSEHRQRANAGQTSTFYAAMRQLGVDNFRIILHHLFPCNSVEELHAEENKTLNACIQQGQDVYNMMIEGKHSTESKARMAATRAGLEATEKQKTAWKSLGKRRQGVSLTIAHKEKISKAKTDVALSHGCIGLYTDKQTEKWLFTWRSEGKGYSRTFAVKKHGFWQAKKLAQMCVRMCIQTGNQIQRKHSQTN